MKSMQCIHRNLLGSVAALVTICVALSFTAGCKKKTDEAPSTGKSATEKAGDAAAKAGDAAAKAGDAAAKAGDAAKKAGDAAAKATAPAPSTPAPSAPKSGTQ